jgi:radical SAM-linked protein
LSYGPPLALGFTSEAEYLDVQLELPAQSYMLEKLAKTFPTGYQLLGSNTVFGKTTSLSSRLNVAVYQIRMDHPIDEIKAKTEEILNLSELEINRETKSGTQQIDIRQAIIGLQPESDDDKTTLLTIESAMADLGFVKPQEILQFGYNLSAQEIMSLIIHRKAVYRLENENRIEPFDLI